jgi:hypothetical protein
MWLINWILLVGEYILITVVMLFQVQGLFGYITGTITLVITGILINLWLHWPDEVYIKQSLMKKEEPKRRYGKYYY